MRVVQTANAPPSRLHSKVEFTSVEVKAKLAAVLFVGLAGLLLIVVSGGVRSIIHENDAGVASVFPAGSIARTLKV